MQVVNQPATPQFGDVAVAVVFHMLAEVVPVAREVVARAECRAVQAVVAIVFQVVSLEGGVAARLPFHCADVAVPASSVKAVGIVQLLLEHTVGDACKPPVHVVGQLYHAHVC